MKGQFSGVLWGLIPAALFVVVFGLILVYGTDILDDNQQSLCDGTWIASGSGVSGNPGGVNALTGGNFGCCETLAAGNNCTTWEHDVHSLNVSIETLEAATDMADRQSTIVGVIVAGAIITILLAVFVMKR